MPSPHDHTASSNCGVPEMQVVLHEITITIPSRGKDDRSLQLSRQLLRALLFIVRWIVVCSSCEPLIRQSRSGQPLDFSGVPVLEHEPHHSSNPPAKDRGPALKFRALLLDTGVQGNVGPLAPKGRALEGRDITRSICNCGRSLPDAT